MKRAILVATVMAFSLAASAAFATAPIQVNWAENFDAMAVGTNLHDTGFPWSPGGNINAYTVQGGGGGNMVLQTSNPGATQYEWCETILGNQATENVQWFHFKAKSTETATDTRFRDSIVVTNNGGEVARFEFNASQFRPRCAAGGWIGTAANYNNGLWHDFDIIYDVTVGTFDYYYDGALYQSRAAGETRRITNAELWGRSWYGGPGWQYDDLAVGTTTLIPPVPEPSSLLAFATFGIGAFGLIRRRRA